MIRFDEAIERLLHGVRPLGSERVGIEESAGRVLGEDVVAGFDLPAFGQYQPATYSVGQLANIARPVVLAHGNQGVVAEAAGAAAGFMAVEVGKVVGQHG